MYCRYKISSINRLTLALSYALAFSIFLLSVFLQFRANEDNVKLLAQGQLVSYQLPLDKPEHLHDVGAHNVKVELLHLSKGNEYTT